VRGRPAARDLRDAVVEHCARAASEPSCAPNFARALRRLHDLASRGELLSLDAGEVRELTVQALRSE
jgi:hypothetical protein